MVFPFTAAKVVLEPNPVPPGYIAQNIYISEISEEVGVQGGTLAVRAGMLLLVVSSKTTTRGDCPVQIETTASHSVSS